MYLCAPLHALKANFAAAVKKIIIITLRNYFELGASNYFRNLHKMASLFAHTTCYQPHMTPINRRGNIQLFLLCAAKLVRSRALSKLPPCG